MNKPQLESRKLGAWHDLIERLWRDIDPATLSPDFQDYAAARAAFADYLLAYRPGQACRCIWTAPQPRWVPKSSASQLASWIGCRRVQPTLPKKRSSCVINLPALVARDGGQDMARLLTCVIEAAFPRPVN